MKNPFKVLEQKEADLVRVRHEVESLRLVTSLLAEGASSVQSDDKETTPEENARDADSALEPTGSDGLSASGATSGSSIFKMLKRSKAQEGN